MKLGSEYEDYSKGQCGGYYRDPLPPSPLKRQQQTLNLLGFWVLAGVWVENLACLSGLDPDSQTLNSGEVSRGLGMRV